MDEMIIAFGDAVKSYTKDGMGFVEAQGIRYGNDSERDLVGDYFDAQTDFGPNAGNGVAATLNHRIPMITNKTTKSEKDALIKLAKTPFKNAVTTEKNDIGIFVRHVLDLSDEYEKTVFELVNKGKFRWSSGSAPHMIDREPNGRIKTWHIVEWAYTPFAAEPNLPTIAPIKTLIEFNEVGFLQKEIEEIEDKNVQGSSSATQLSDSANKKRVKKMTQENVVNHEDYAAQMKSILNEWRVENIDKPMEDVKSLNARVNQILDYVESRGVGNPGYFTEDGGSKDPSVKSFGDFLLAVRRKDVKRLHTVYKSGYTKDMGEDAGATGGYLVPKEYADTLLQVTPQASPVLSRVQVIPVSRPSGDWPSLDMSFTPAAGQSPFAGRVAATAKPENTTLAETQPYTDMLQWRVNKVGGYTQVSNELINDSPFAVEALLRGVFQVAINAKREYLVLRGTGAGEPLGLLNAASSIGVTPATNSLFSWTDVGAMQAKLFQIGTQAPVWIIHPSVWPDILTMEIGTSGANAWVANMQGGQSNMINGYQIIQSTHLPNADSSGDVILTDLFGYLLFQREDLTIDFSSHVGFLEDQGTWRFVSRVDGMPWLRSALIADPGGYTMSSCVYHND